MQKEFFSKQLIQKIYKEFSSYNHPQYVDQGVVAPASFQETLDKLREDGLFDYFLNCKAIFSENTETQKAHATERNNFFEILKKSFSNDENNGGIFDANKAKEAWQKYSAEINPNLIQLHANQSNLDIQSKFITGEHLLANEWLTDLDLLKLIALVGLKKEVTVTSLTSENIATTLDFKIKEFKKTNSPEAKKLLIPFLINKSESTGGERGIHWIRALIEVDLAAHSIVVNHTDTLPITEQEKERVKNIFTAAVKKQELIKKFKITCNATSDQQIQDDSWSCGYRAFKGLIVDLNAKAFFKDKALKENEKDNKDKVLTCGYSSGAHRDCCYDLLLNGITLPDKNSLVADKKIKTDLLKQNTNQVDPTCINNFLNLIKNGADLPQQLDKIALEKMLQIQECIGQISCNEFIKSSKDKISIDLQAYFDRKLLASDEKYSAEIKIEAKIQVLAEAIINFGCTKASVTNFDAAINAAKKDIKEAGFIAKLFRQKFSKISGVTEFETDLEKNQQPNLTKTDQDQIKLEMVNTIKEQHDIFACLLLISKRNNIIKEKKLFIDSKKNIWDEFFCQKLLNFTFQDNPNQAKISRHFVLNDNLFASDEDEYGLEFSFDKSVLYFKEFFVFLSTHQKFLQQVKDFPMDVFHIETAGANQKPNDILLDELVTHLEAKRYFPFKTIKIVKHEYDFEKLKRLILSSKDSSIEQINIEVNELDECGRNTLLTQLKTLTNLCSDNKLTTKITFSPAGRKFYFGCGKYLEAEKTLKEAELKLENIIWQNHKNAHNVDKNNQLSKSVIETVTPVENFFDIRRCKLANFDYKKNTITEISVENENQQEHQVEAQQEIQQEAQKEAEAEQQQQNEIAAIKNSCNEVDLIDAEKFKNDDYHFGNRLNIFNIQTGEKLPRSWLSTLNNLQSDKFWNNAIGQNALPLNIRYITQSAGDEIIEHMHRFVDGVNPDNLPEGFFIQNYNSEKDPTKNGKVLCYDRTKYVENKNQSPLTIKLKKVREMTDQYSWYGSLSQFTGEDGDVLDDTFKGIFTGDFIIDYSKANVDNFKTWYECLKFNCKSSELAQQKPQNYLAITEKYSKFFAALDKLDNKNLSGKKSKIIFQLMDLLYHTGTDEVDALLRILENFYTRSNGQDAQLADQFISTFIVPNDDGVSLGQKFATTDNFKAIAEITSLTADKLSWFTQLSLRQKAMHGCIDFNEVWLEFNYFLNEIEKLGVYNLPKIEFKNHYNISIVLDRFLSLTKSIKKGSTIDGGNIYLKDQLQYLTDDSCLDKEGVWYATYFENFKFYHPVMNLTPANSLEKLGFEKNHELVYQVDYNYLKKQADNKRLDLSKLIILFHRFLGCTDRSIYTYENYLNLTKYLQEDALSKKIAPAIKIALLPILARVTTGERACKKFDLQLVQQIFDIVKDQDEKRVISLLQTISDNLLTFDTEPNLNEMVGLIKLSINSGEQKIKNIIERFKIKSNIEALGLWNQHDNHLPAKDFWECISKLQVSRDKSVLSKEAQDAQNNRKQQHDELDAIKTDLTSLQEEKNLFKSTQPDAYDLFLKALKNHPGNFDKSITEQIAFIDQVLATDATIHLLSEEESKKLTAARQSLGVWHAKQKAFSEKHPQEYQELVEALEKNPQLALDQVLDEKIAKIDEGIKLLDRISIAEENQRKKEAEKNKAFDDDFIKLIAILSCHHDNANQQDLATLVANIEAFKTKNTQACRDAVKYLTSLNFQDESLVKGNYKDLPSLSELVELFNAFVVAPEINVIQKIKNTFPKCNFNPQCIACQLTGLEEELLENLNNINWGLQKLFSGVKPISEQDVKNKGDKLPELIIGKIADCRANNSLLFLAKYPLLQLTGNKILKQKFLHEVTKISGEQTLFPAHLENAIPQVLGLIFDASIAQENANKYNTYLKNVKNLLVEIESMKKKWKNFDAKFLEEINTPSGFDVAQSAAILTAIRASGYQYFPAKLFDAIWGANVQFPPNITEDNKNKIIANIIKVIKLDKKIIKLTDKIKLIQSSIAASSLADAGLNELIDLLNIAQTKYSNGMVQYLFKLYATIKNLADKKHLLEQIKTLLNLNQGQKTPQDNEITAAFTIIFDRLKDNASLCEQFISLASAIAGSEPEKKNIHSFLKIAAASCFENDADYETSKLGINTLINLREVCKNADELKQLDALYQKRPYPSFTRLKEFLSLSGQERTTSIDSYALDPPGKRKGNKTFDQWLNLDAAKIMERIDQIESIDEDGIRRKLFLSERRSLLDDITYVTAVAKNHNLLATQDEKLKKPVCKLTQTEMQQLVKEYHSIMSNPHRVNADQLRIVKLEFIALIREAIYRFTGNFPYPMQILSLLNVMLHGGSPFSEINTGEGKGIINALTAAYTWGQGHTYDLYTANIELARRDFAEFGEVFKYLGINCALIKQDSQKEEYQKDGINYSEFNQLQLFKERVALDFDAHFEQNEKGNKIIYSCGLDEADYIMLNNTTLCRFADNLEGTGNNNPDEWAYPIVLAFLQDTKFKQQCSAKQDIINLRKFIGEHQTVAYNCGNKKIVINLVDGQKRVFAHFPDEKLDMWIDAAFNADKLKIDEDYIIRNGEVMIDGESLDCKYAKVKSGNRVSEGSSFSNGMHQFLHAKLNLENFAANEKNAGKSFNPTELGENRFPIEPEKKSLLSVSVKNGLDFYINSGGNIIASSGTIGTETKEMSDNYGSKFYHNPPRVNSQRVEHSPKLATPRGWFIKETSQEAHFREILTQVKKCLRQQQPALIIMEDKLVTIKNKSQHLVSHLKEYLEKHLSANEKKKLQSYVTATNAGKETKEEKEVVMQAGDNGAITISTDALGRGTDIKPKNKTTGLAVIDTYIADERTMGQAFGRAGRNGEKGEAFWIISSDDAHTNNPKNLNKQIKKKQQEINQQKAIQREEQLISSYVKDKFNHKYSSIYTQLKSREKPDSNKQNQSIAELFSRVSKDSKYLWAKFNTDFDYSWNQLLSEIANEKADDKEKLKGKISTWLPKINHLWRNAANAMKVKAIATINDYYKNASNDKEMIKKIADEKKQLLNNIELAFAEPSQDLNHEDAMVKIVASAIEQGIVVNTNQTKSLTSASYINEAGVYFDAVRKIDGVLQQDLKKQALKRMMVVIQQEMLKHSIAPTLIGNLDSNENIKKIFEKNCEDLNILFDYKNRKLMHPYILKLCINLLAAVEKYSDDALKTDIKNVFNAHLAKHAANKLYLNKLLHAVRKISFINYGDSANLIKQNETLNHLIKFALKELQQYGENYIASDRRKLFNSLVTDLALTAGNQHPGKEITNYISLLNKINQQSITAMDHDYSIDQSRDKSWFARSFRNTKPEGSRLQNALSTIRQDIIASVALLSDDKEKTTECFNNQIKFFANKIGYLLDYATLSRLKKSNTIKNIAANEELKAVVDELKNLKPTEDFKTCYQKLLYVLHQLEAHAAKFGNHHAPQHQVDQQAYIKQLTDTIAEIKAFRQSLIISNLKDVANDSQLQLHNGLQKLQANNYLIEKKVFDPRRFKNLINEELLKQINHKKEPKITDLILSSCYEIERWAQKEHRMAYKISGIKFDNGQLTIALLYDDKIKNIRNTIDVKLNITFVQNKYFVISDISKEDHLLNKLENKRDIATQRSQDLDNMANKFDKKANQIKKTINNSITNAISSGLTLMPHIETGHAPKDTLKITTTSSIRETKLEMS